MKRLFLFLFSVCIFPVISAKTDERYIMKALDNGQLYFILPYEIPAQTAKTNPLSADITYLTASDSVTMNISVWTLRELAADSIVFDGGDRITIKDFETFFIEPDGRQWLHRYSLHFPLVCLTQLYTCSSPFSLCIYAGEQKVLYGWSSVKAWSKEQEWMNRILHIIDNNRRLYRKP